MRFLVDQPLKGLAKWLRLAGLDTVVTNFSAQRRDLPPPAPGTYILTRQTGCRGLKREDLLFLEADTPEEQLGEVCRRLHISRRDLAPLSRCGECNDPLVPAAREKALGAVPDHVFHTQEQFFQCPRCQRFFWPGSHPARIAATLDKVLQEQDGGPSPPTPFQKGASHGD